MRRLRDESQKSGLEFSGFGFKDSLSQFPQYNRPDSLLAETYDFVLHRNLSCLPYQSFYAKKFVLSSCRQLNENHLFTFPIYNKLIQYDSLQKHDIPLIPTVYQYRNLSYKDVTDIFEETSFVVKPINGSFGSDIELINSQEGFNQYFSSHSLHQTLIQRYIPTQSDFRVLILGTEVLGILERFRGGHSIITNVSAGNRAQKGVLKSEITDLAILSSQALNLEYAGVDIILDSNGHPFIIEVNNSPQFEGFERETGVNVAEKIIQYLVT
jgi:RimK family alpha-L-glutamate ligase